MQKGKTRTLILPKGKLRTKKMEDEVGFRCGKCNRVLKTAKGLRAHIKKSTCTREGKVECDQCGGYFGKRGLAGHKKRACPMKSEEEEQDPDKMKATINAMTEEISDMRNEIQQIKKKAAEDAERITMSEKTTERTVRLPRGTKFTNAQAINMMQLEGAHPIGVEGSHEVDEYVVDKLVQEVKFPQPGMNKDERVKKTARVLQVATRVMMDTHQGSRNMVIASDLGYRMVYLYVTLAVGDESTAILQATTLADAILMSYTLSVEVICDHLSTKLGKEWKKVADTLEQTFKEHEGQIVSMSKDEFERTLQGLYTDVRECLTSTPLWKKETDRQKKKREAAVGVVPV
jgi:hypothetical protein